MFGIIAITAMFVMVLIVCWRVLPDMGFDGISRAGLAICVAALCVLGLVQFAANSPEGAEATETNYLDGLLLPYAALGVSILLLPLVLLISRWMNRMQMYELRKRSSHDGVPTDRRQVHRKLSSIPTRPAQNDGKRH